MRKPTRIHPAQHSVAVFFHAPEFGVTVDEILKPEYWSNVAPQLRPGSRVEVLAADGSWWAMLIVRAASRTEAFLAALQVVEFDQAAAVADEGAPYEVKWRGPARKFGVVRKSDGEVIKDEFQLKEHAALWLKNHMQNMAA